MSDPNKFINTYIDTAIAALHEYLGSSLQLKTQLKLANDLLQERDGVIASLTAEIENVKNSSIKHEDMDSLSAELLACQDRLRIAEESHNALKVKVSHMDTLTNQLIDMKNEIKVRDDKIAVLNEQLIAKDAHISSLNSTILEKDEEIANLEAEMSIKENEIARLTKKPDPPKSSNEKAIKESSTVKVQLNNKSKPKELPIDDDF